MSFVIIYQIKFKDERVAKIRRLQLIQRHVRSVTGAASKESHPEHCDYEEADGLDSASPLLAHQPTGQSRRVK